MSHRVGKKPKTERASFCIKITAIFLHILYKIFVINFSDNYFTVIHLKVRNYNYDILSGYLSS